MLRSLGTLAEFIDRVLSRLALGQPCDHRRRPASGRDLPGELHGGSRRLYAQNNAVGAGGWVQGAVRSHWKPASCTPGQVLYNPLVSPLDQVSRGLVRGNGSAQLTGGLVRGKSGNFLPE